MLQILILFTLLSLYLIISGIIYKKEEVKSTGIIFILIVIIFGWVFLGYVVNMYESTWEINTSYIIDNTKIIVVDSNNNNKYEFNKKIDFDYITDTTTFYIVKNYNIYGLNREYYIYYKIGNGKIKGKRIK